MSVTQYIGARYVPLFADPDQWSSDRAYEPLTIVLHEGNSYTSKQAVPIGIDITNKAFWAQTANYNAQVEAYRREVQQFADDIDEAQRTAELAQEAITAETEARESADESLQEAITAETSSRETADTELQEAIKMKSVPTYYQPQHIGDFIIAEKLGCVCRHEDNFYAFSSKDDGSELGTITICDQATNRIRKLENKRVGHANSCANDIVRNRIWLAPMSNNSTPINSVFWYNYQFSQLNEIQLDFSPQGVSFDPVTNTVWLSSRVTESQFKLYKMEESESEFTYFGAVENAFVYPTGQSSFQDFAVYDNIAYFVDTTMNMQIVDLETLSTIKMAVISNQSAQWRYGECEGIEFDKDGNLFQGRYSPAGFTPPGSSFSLCLASITALSTTPNGGVSGVMPYTAIRGYTISADTQEAFTNERYQLKTANFLQWLVAQPCTINYSGTVTEPWPIYPEAYGDLTIVIPAGADVTIPNIQLSRNKLVVYIANASGETPKGILRFTNSEAAGMIQATSTRPASLCFCNLGILICPPNLVNIAQFGYNAGMIIYQYQGTIQDINGNAVTPTFNGKTYESAGKLIVGSRSIEMPVTP